MTKEIKFILPVVVFLVFIVSGCVKKTPDTDTAVPAVAEAETIPQPAHPEGDFEYFEGEVMIIPPGETSWSSVDSETLLEEGTTVKTGPDSFARLYLDENKQIDMDEESSFEIKSKGEDSCIEMFYGAMRTRISGIDRDRVEIYTPVAVASVRGTDFAVIYEKEDLCEVEVYTGSIQLASAAQEETDFIPIEVNENFAASVRSAQAPEIIGEITDLRQLRWIHLDERMKTFNKLRKLRTVEASLRRQRGLLRAASQEEQSAIRQKIARLRTEQTALEREAQAHSDRLDEVSRRYAEIREEQALRRRQLIEQQREEIIQERLRKIEEERERRRRELED